MGRRLMPAARPGWTLLRVPCRAFLGQHGITTGEREIDPARARIVVRIFEEFVNGRSPKATAQQLNAEHVPGPSGGPWGPSTIHGHAGRGTGVLNNELYIGQLVWNRLRYLNRPRLRPPRVTTRSAIHLEGHVRSSRRLPLVQQSARAARSSLYYRAPTSA